MFGTRAQLQNGRVKPLLLFYLVLAAVIWLARGWILAGSFQNVVLVLLGLAVFGITGVILGNWRTGVYFFLAWLLFEDLARKFLGNGTALFFGKDALVAMVYLSLLKARSLEKVVTFRPPFLLPLGLFILLGIAQVFNSGSPSILYGILGMKLYFYYIPLLFVGYAMLRDEADLRRFLAINMGLAGLIALLGIVQSVVGQSFLSPKTLDPDLELLGNLTRYSPSGAAVSRPTSVFVSDGRFAHYLILTFIIGAGAAGYLLLRTKRGRKLVFASLALVGLAGMMSGSRGCASYIAISALVLSAGLLWGAPPRAAETYRLFKAIRRTAIVIALSLALGAVLFPQAIGARWSLYVETLDPRSSNYEVPYRAWDYPVHNLLLALTDPDWLIGHGIGTQSLGVQYVARLTGAAANAALPRFWVEEGYGTMITEFGILGPILWLGWTLSFIYAGWKAALRVKGTATFPVALSILWFGFLLLFPITFAGISPYQNFVLNAYFWLLAGVLFRLPTLTMQHPLQAANSIRSS
jgi:hypothetical protein